MTSPLHQPGPHESAWRHVTGEALYTDDLVAPGTLLHGWVVPSPHAHARILRRSAEKALALPGVEAVLFAADVPGSLHVGPIVHDEDILAQDHVLCVGQAVAVVVATSRDICRQAAALVEVEYEVLPAILSIPDAIEKEAFLTTAHHIRRGDVEAALAVSAVVIRAVIENGGQDHFYLETHAALAIPEEGGTWKVFSSTQHPSEVQSEVASVLGIGRHQVVVEVPRLGGGFGGKESQASNVACFAALGARAAGRACKVWYDRDQDMIQTGKRHPFRTEYAAGFDATGRILALRAAIYSDGGFSADLSTAVLDRALYHADNAYFLENVDIVGRVCRTHLPSNTAFRGFGGPQGILVVEDACNRAAERLGLDPAIVRVNSFYGEAPRNTAHYEQTVHDPRAKRIWDELSVSADYGARRAAIDDFNVKNRWVKRGIGFMPLKFGISFTNAMLNQAGAFINIYADGTVQLNHGGTEMGQGLHTKMLAVCAHELGVKLSAIRAMNTSTDKVPNTSATAASSGTDLNGMAVFEACTILRERMRPTAASLLKCEEEQVQFVDGEVREPTGRSVPFAEVAKICWISRVSLSATGFYRTPGIAYNRDEGKGTPFFYYAWGGAIVEVELNGLTGEHRIHRTDILHDVGDPLNPAIDKGQVEGAFIQGIGWLTAEEVIFDAKGRLLTHGPSTYKIPSVGDLPEDFRVFLLERAAQPGTIGGSKAVGEPPLMLAIGVVTALRHAVAGFGVPGQEIELAIPCTPEALLRAVQHASRKSP